MMSFNLQKYLTENNLTLIQKIREDADEQPQEVTTEPETPVKDLEKKKADLVKMKARVKDIIMKYTVDTPDGRQIKDIEAYKKAVGSLPQQIKHLQNQIDDSDNNKTKQDDENID